MAIRSGVGRSSNRNSSTAGSEAAAAAMAPLGGARPSMVFAFATAGYDQPELLRAISEATGPCPLAGCSAEGVITRESGSDESSHAVAVMAIAASELRFHTFSVPAVGQSAREAAAALVAQIRERDARGRLLLLFPDGLTANCGQLIAALEGALPFPVQLAGGTAGDYLRFERTYQYCDGRVASDSLSAVLVEGAFEPEVVVSHGCDLIGTERTITRAHDGEVLEIDGRRAWDVFREYLEPGAASLDAMHVAHLTVAERLPDEAGSAFGDRSIRVPIRLDVEKGSLFFAAGMTEGTRIRIALRNPEKVCQRAVEAAESLRARRPDAEPLLVLQLDCAGRGRLLFGEDTNPRLMRPLHAVFGEKVPWLGLHTYGEIAPLTRRSYFHNYTGVLCALYPPRA